KTSGLFALGGLDYDADPGKAPAEPALAPFRGVLPGRPQGGFGPLPGTAVEVRRLAALYRKAAPKDNVTLLTGGEPTRTRLEKELQTLSRSLHRAPPGFFESPARLVALMAGLRAPDKGLTEAQLGQRADSLAFLPFLKSGLVLAGANRGPQEGQDTGLLTAEGGANPDPHGCELVVLSAREAGLGDVTLRREGGGGAERGL